MRIDHPIPTQIPALRRLWQEAFGDTDAFLGGFFDRVFSPDRCRCIFAGKEAAAALYWLDCDYNGGKLAYLYAVATAEASRNQGLCRALMEDTHALLQARGYAGAVLVPGEAGLFAMYEKMGYVALSCMDTLTVCSDAPIALKAITPEEYAAARKMFLPSGGVIQEKENQLRLKILRKRLVITVMEVHQLVEHQLEVHQLEDLQQEDLQQEVQRQVEDYLQINYLKLFQKIILHAMFTHNSMVFVACRGLG